MERKEIIYFIILFVVIHIIGLFTANYYIQQGMNVGVFTNNPNSLLNSVLIITYIIVLTAGMLLLKKVFKKGRFLYIFEYLALFAGCSIVFMTFLSEVLAYFLAVYLLLIKTIYNDYKRTSLWINNILLAIALAGAGTMLGISLGIIPIMFFIFLLSVYDIVAVFYTKHMLVLAKTITEKKLAFLFVIPTKKKELRLGGGDIAIPMMVSASLFNVLLPKYCFFIVMLPIIGIWISSVLGLLITFYVLDITKAKGLPALPVQVMLMMVILFVTFFTLI
jgi:presenilin-like A22 family membrane protease